MTNTPSLVYAAHMNWQDDISKLANQRPYFDASATGTGRPAFVMWLDVMGTKSALEASVPRAINFVMKLHVAILETKTEAGAHYFPMNDGAFLVHQDWHQIETLARNTLRRLAITYALEPEPRHRFMVRGAVAHGNMLFGLGMTGNNIRLSSAYGAEFARRIVLGPPLAEAYSTESNAPPFGVALAPSVAEKVEPARDGLWRWFDHPQVEPCVREGLAATLSDGLKPESYGKASIHLAAFKKMMTP